MTYLQRTAATAFALVACAGAASAATHHSVTGKIDHLDRAKNVLVVRNHSYRCTPQLLGENIHAGDRVIVEYRNWRGYRTALKVAPVKV